MSESLKFVPPRVAFTDPRTGMITREWFLFLQGLFIRVGGSTGSSTTDAAVSMFEDAGTSEVDARLRSVEDALQQDPTISAMQADIEALRQQVQSLQQGPTP